jgi:hypothetical protein
MRKLNTRLPVATTLLIAIPLVLGLAGCSAPLRMHYGLIERLRDRGPVAVSPTNPYLAANVLLNKETETSHELKGFFDHRGAPAAIEVSDGLLKSLTLMLYYPENGESFMAEESAGSWAIRGPFPIEKAKLREVLLATGKLRPVQTTVPPIQTTVPKAAPPDQTAAPASTAPAQHSRVASATHSAPNTGHTIDPKLPESAQPRERAAEPAIESDALAEVSPRGDVVHYVTFANEDLRSLAQWYTGDASNAARLARINQLKPQASLSPGDSIVVPSYLVKNKRRLSEETLKVLKRLP